MRPFHHHLPVIGCALLAMQVLHGSPDFAADARSPENQVFQWHISAENTGWPDGSKNKATLYLWIPEQTKRVRGVVVMCANVPEHMLVGHAAIRHACADNDLALVWSVPSFWRFGKAAPAPGAEPVDVKTLPGSDSIQIAFLEKMLVALAEKSGYAEIASAPLLPIGESGHLLMVGGLLKVRPERCIAAICVKNPGEKSSTVPVLWTLGTGQEWKQTTVDLRSHWKNTGDYDTWCRERAVGRLPLSIAIEPGTGHFYVSDSMTELFAAYITAAVKARVAGDDKELLPLKLEDGVLANLPIPGQSDLAIIPYRDAKPEQLARPWFFDADLARQAQRLSEADWEAAPQLVAFQAGAGCRVEPYALNSVTEIFAECDGEFSVGAELLENVPEPFPDAGTELSRAPGEPLVEWICGPFAPSGNGRFRVALDRTWTGKAAAYVIARHEGDDGIRRTVQPARVTFTPNTTGQAQSIDFAPIPDAEADNPPISLHATADSGLPVSFFVDHGPAVVEEDKLKILPLPPRTRYPVEVVVTAWQWGRRSDPPVQTAEPVTRTFQILAP